MEEDGKSLEDLAKKLFNRSKVKIRGLYLADIDNLYEYLHAINYALLKNYIIEAGEFVKDFHYQLTPEGNEWAGK
jgi:hypothetical protein